MNSCTFCSSQSLVVERIYPESPLAITLPLINPERTHLVLRDSARLVCKAKEELSVTVFFSLLLFSYVKAVPPGKGRVLWIHVMVPFLY